MLVKKIKPGDPVWVRHWSSRGAAKGRVVEVWDNHYIVTINGRRLVADKRRVKPR